MKQNEKWLEFLREQFPKGSQIKVREMIGPHPPIKPGAIGALEQVDDSGHFHVSMDDGSALTLVLGEDSFSVLPPEPQLLKLYMPMTIGYYEEEDEETVMDEREASGYADTVAGALHREEGPEEAVRGLMHHYHKDDGVNHKVRSYRFTAEARAGRLWGVAECLVVGRLTPEELETLKENVSGQASDGLGEGFEQRPIDVDGRKMFAHLWQWDNWDIQTEQERFDPELAEGLPEMCFSVLPGEGKLICIKRGERGFLSSDWDTGDPIKNRKIAAFNNEKLGVSKAQEEAMRTGSMFGWDCPGADPARYAQYERPQIGGMKLE